MSTTIGFIGLGAMGMPMARNLAAAGYPLRVHDAMPALASRFAAETGALAVSLREIGCADVVITMLPTSQIVSTVLLGDEGAAQAMRAGAIVIEMSSGVPDETQAIARQLGQRGIRLLDAPVSGGVRRALSGELSIIVGGEAEALKAVEPILFTLGRTVTHVGRIGAGQAMKALNNLALAGSFLIALEALLVGKKYGLDPAAMVDVLNNSSGMNYNTQTKFKQYVLSGSYAAGFSLELLVKDVQIALDLADRLDAATPFSSRCGELWSEALQQLGAGHDHTEIAKVAAAAAGVAL